MNIYIYILGMVALLGGCAGNRSDIKLTGPRVSALEDTASSAQTYRMLPRVNTKPPELQKLWQISSAVQDVACNSTHVAVYEGKGAVAVYAASTGKRLWRVVLPPHAHYGHGGGVVLHQNKVFVSLPWGRVVAFDVTQGKVLWQQDMGAPLHQKPCVFGARVFVLLHNQKLQALHQDTGQVQWTYEGSLMDTVPYTVTSITGKEDKLWVVFPSKDVVCFHGATGQVQWQKNIADLWPDSDDALFAPGVGRHLYVGMKGQGVVALSLQDGRVIWHHTPEESATTMACHQDMVAVAGELLVYLRQGDTGQAYAPLQFTHPIQRISLHQGMLWMQSQSGSVQVYPLGSTQGWEDRFPAAEWDDFHIIPGYYLGISRRHHRIAFYAQR